jgi:hypothetical protein
VVDEVQACKVDKAKRSPSKFAHRNHEYVFFEKRGGEQQQQHQQRTTTTTCEQLLRLEKRQHGDGGNMAGHGAAAVPAFNVIKPIPGKQAYARISAAMYNELFYTQADKSGLMTLGAQHGVSYVLRGAYNPLPAWDTCKC